MACWYHGPMHDEWSPTARFFRKQANSIWRRLSGKPTYYDAQKFVATDAISGRAQMEILVREGLRPTSHVLEVGCGCLSAGMPILSFLEPDHYVGIDPNDWLIETAMRRSAWRDTIQAKRPVFLHNMAFDATESGRKFDFVLSHSILSHAAANQLPLFLANVGKTLSPSGKIFASLILAEGSEFHPGTADGQDSNDAEWVYPGCSYFTHDTINAAAAQAGLTATYRLDITQRHVKVRPLEVHDWFEFKLA